MLHLKDYQKETLDTLDTYLHTARLHGAEQAFYTCLPEDNRQRYKTHEVCRMSACASRPAAARPFWQPMR